ncbi:MULTISPECIES: MFS transporter [Amycolatopsis]|uniref:MFS transporter n=2 Tax=Amycolatopsis TaxID=1813 RepID=A0ABP8VL60_9PSEU|nr:MFS transporter [Amycolatopsis sacchari]SFI79621.1 metabolite-proton symporter [Amycolatopsis sacchari]
MNQTRNVVAPARTSGRTVGWASFIGTSVEWYDYHVYSIASALVIGKLFFPAFSSLAGTLAAFATFAVGFVARPVGGILAGHLGDRIGRKRVLLATLITMGASTTLIGLLPTYDTIGPAAPVLLVLLRLVQGISAGGEWGGASLMAVEHAPPAKRGLFGNFTQLGTPAGMFLANVVLLSTTFALPDEAFRSWGWRIPFLLSFVMVLVGYFIRRRAEESPVFRELQQAKETLSVPLAELFRHHKKRILIAVGTFVGNNACGYIFLTFVTAYGTSALGLSRNFLLDVLLVGCVSWFGSMIFFAWLSDRVGRRPVYLGGYAGIIVWAVPFFALLNTANPGLVILAVVVLTFGLAATYGPQAALFAEFFPAAVRMSGSSVSYAVGACLAGGFSPLIATALWGASGTVFAVSAFMIAFCLVSVLAVHALRWYSSTLPEADGSHRRL